MNDFPTNNLLLQSLPPDEWRRLMPYLAPVFLTRGEQLESAEEPIRFLYFIESGICSIEARMLDGRRCEVGLVGREGMTGTALARRGSRSPHDFTVLLEGAAVRLLVGELEAALHDCPSLRMLQHRYAITLGIQAQYSALAAAKCSVRARLARWLLMVHDRMDEDQLRLTHGDISRALGVRRPGVTIALHELEGLGLIRARRSQIVIRDREKLILHADGAYTLAEAEYTRVTGIPLTREQVFA